MTPCLLRIAAEPKQGAPTTKTRTFSAHLLAILTADAFWDSGGTGKAERPVWLAFFATESESQPFAANLRAGRKAVSPDLSIELPRRVHRWSTQKVPGGLVTVAYLPDLFHIEPVTSFAEAVRFVFAPPRWWITEQAADLAGELGEDAPDAARAALFCAYLDRRTALPLVHDLRFHLQVYRAALTSGWAYPLANGRGGVFRGRGAEALGLDAPVACSVGQEELSAFLIEQTSLYHRKEIDHGATCVERAGRLLSFPCPTAPELRIDSEVA